MLARSLFHSQDNQVLYLQESMNESQAGCSLTRTFALIDGRGEVSYFATASGGKWGIAPRETQITCGGFLREM